jgi:alpha-beta hydrolase superfamily lysophospholipase
VSASFLLASRKLDRDIRTFPPISWRGGVHLFVAGRDKIIDNDRTRRWYRGLPIADRRMTEFAEGEHTLEFEADPSSFHRALVDWIAERCDPQA